MNLLVLAVNVCKFTFVTITIHLLSNSFFVIIKGNPESDFKNGFTAAGPVYTFRDSYIDECLKNSIPQIFTLKCDINFLTTYNWKDVNEDEVKGEIERQVIKYLELNPNLFGWYILPEELRPWRKNELAFLNLVTQTIRKYDQQHPIISYSPYNRDCYGLCNLTKNGLDYIGKNAYVLFESKEDRTKIIESMKCSMEAYNLIKSEGNLTEHSRMGIYLHLAMDPALESEDCLIPALAKHDVFLSVVCGASFILVWSLFRRVSVYRTYHIQYKAYADSMNEINKKAIQIDDKQTLTLAEIFLNSPKLIEHSESRVTHAVYTINENAKLVVSINSTNSQQKHNEILLEPFEVKYDVVRSTVIVEDLE